MLCAQKMVPVLIANWGSPAVETVCLTQSGSNSLAYDCSKGLSVDCGAALFNTHSAASLNTRLSHSTITLDLQELSVSHTNSFALRGTQAWPTMFFTRLWEQHAHESPRIIGRLLHMQAEQQRVIDSQVAVGAKSARGLYESHFDLFRDPDASLQRLVQFIERSLALAVCVANDQEAQPEQVAIEFVDSWYHVTNHGGFHDAHVHHGCSWCGIYYLQLGSSGQRQGDGAPNGGSRFYCPFNGGGGYRDFGNKYLSNSIDAPLEDGLLLLFPSYLMHSGLPYTGNIDRIVVAFNAQAKLR